jgi:hypothetical protein
VCPFIETKDPIILDQLIKQPSLFTHKTNLSARHIIPVGWRERFHEIIVHFSFFHGPCHERVRNVSQNKTREIVLEEIINFFSLKKS